VSLDNWHRRVRRIGQRIGHIGPANEPIEPIGKPPRALDNWTIGTAISVSAPVTLTANAAVSVDGGQGKHLGGI
jgi:hypothetical protein